MGRRTREVDEVGADLAWWHDHQVDLGAAAQLDGRPLRPAAQDLADAGHRGEAPDQLTACIGLRQQVEIADRLTPAAEGAGWDEGTKAIRPDKGAHDGAQPSGRLAEPHADAPLAEAGQGVEDALLRLRTEALDAAQAPSPSGRFEVLDGGDAQRGVELVRRARARALAPPAGRAGSAAPRHGAARGNASGPYPPARRACPRWPALHRAGPVARRAGTPRRPTPARRRWHRRRADRPGP